jgi:predicted branched-subunit amino acid permease
METTAPACTTERPGGAPPAETTAGALWAGARAMVPLALAVTPQALTLGLALGQLPVDHLAAWSTSPLLYAGSAQLALVTEYATEPTGPTAIGVALLINARLLFYSAALAPHWRDRSARWRLLAAYLLIDPSFALAQQRYGRPGTAHGRATFYLGGAVLLWAWWQLTTAAGLLAPAAVPHLPALSAAAPLCFVALLCGAIRDRATAVAVAAAGLVAAGLAGLPGSIGLAVAMVVGVLAGGRAARRKEVDR